MFESFLETLLAQRGNSEKDLASGSGRGTLEFLGLELKLGAWSLPPPRAGLCALCALDVMAEHAPKEHLKLSAASPQSHHAT